VAAISVPLIAAALLLLAFILHRHHAAIHAFVFGGVT